MAGGRREEEASANLRTEVLRLRLRHDLKHGVAGHVSCVFQLRL